MEKVRILSLDGGGIRGIIPAVILEQVEKKLQDLSNNKNARLADYFDMIAGTSTGGILTCFYLCPDNNRRPKYTASKAVDFYSKKGIDIFNKSKNASWFGLKQLFNATKYKPCSLESIFKEEFEDRKLKDLLKPCLVTTYNMQQKRSHFFTNSNPDKEDYFVRDVARSTSAAPTYFPPAFINDTENKTEMVNIDGGVFANNPAMCAYAECRKMKFGNMEYPAAKDMLLLSIGTGGGRFDLPDTKKSKNWGVVNWAKSIPDIMMDGSIDTVNYQMKNMFATLPDNERKNYKRIDVPLDKRDYSKDMADASPGNIEKLKNAGMAAFEDANIEKAFEHKLDDFIKLLI